MSFANFDEICRICRESEEEELVAKENNLRHIEVFPEGFSPEIRLADRRRFFLTDKDTPRFLPKEEDDAVYIIRYGQLI